MGIFDVDKKTGIKATVSGPYTSFVRAFITR